MRPSKYNFTVDLKSGEELLIYNTLYGSLTLLEGREVKPGKQLLEQTSSIDSSTSRIRKTLASQRHLIADDFDELAELRTRKLAGVHDSNRLDLIILPTLNCNFACTYCYEDNRNENMTVDTEQKLCRWMARNITKYKLVMLHWFGGEPLTRTNQLVRITTYARRLTAGKDTLLLPHVTSNGYHLSKKVINKLLEAEIRSFQVTLDGPAETHDRLRVLRGGGKTFDRIYQGITELIKASQRVKISLRINFNHTNLHAIPSLLEHFPPPLRPQLRVVFEPVFGNQDLSALENISSEEIGERLASYYRLAESLGYDITFSKSTVHAGRLVYCYAERENQLIIGPTGDVFKCSVGTFKRSDRVGYLSENGNLIKEDKWSNWIEDSISFEPKCTECVFLPLCMGGCKKVQLTSPRNRKRCALAATNASYILKQVALGRMNQAITAMTL